jgi:hypothetical protein
MAREVIFGHMSTNPLGIEVETAGDPSSRTVIEV